MALSTLLAELHAAAPLIGPSLLACDFGHLQREVECAEEAGARVFHLDVMDGHFVPNLSFGLPIVEAVRRATELPLDVHLMMSQPARFLAAFRDAGADLITVHVESEGNPAELLEEIRSRGAGAGITLSPDTPVSAVEPYLDRCDLALVMSVMPGFGGQAFDPVALAKIRRIAELGGPDLLVSVDGGVNEDTIAACAGAGAKLFVVGTAFFSHSDYEHRLAQLAGLARSAGNVRTY